MKRQKIRPRRPYAALGSPDFDVSDLPFCHPSVPSFQICRSLSSVGSKSRFRLSVSRAAANAPAAPTVVTQRGRVYDEETGAEWRVQAVWPFESAYLISWLDEGYERAIVGVPSHRFVWVLSRVAHVSEAEFASLYERVAGLGYDPGLLRRVPHRPSTMPPKASTATFPIHKKRG